MGDLDARGIRLVPVFLWNPLQFPAMSGEALTQLMIDPNSLGWQLLAKFVEEFVVRYRKRSTILFYELTNELNLWADLDHPVRCRRARGPSRHCAVMGTFTTAQLIAFTGRFAGLLRKLDNRQISSGFSVPRAAAAHLRARPEWSAQGADWTPDSRQEFVRELLDLHRHVDIVSVHLYDTPENIRFGLSDAASLLDVIKDASDAAGKPLFIGEFGDRSVTVPERQSHAARVLDRIVTRRVPYSAIWTWQFYQTSLYETHNSEATASSIEPGAGDWLINRVRQASAALGSPTVLPRRSDRPQPRVVLTWPVACALMAGKQHLYAVASDGLGHITGVEFVVNEDRIAVDNSYPYTATLDASKLKPGLHTLLARAYDQAGNMAEYRTRVFVGKTGSLQSCLAD